jgi:hypothetical protein
MPNTKTMRAFIELMVKKYQLRGITESGKGDNYMHCTLCNCDISVNTKTVKEIKQHLRTKKHERVEKWKEQQQPKI